MKRKLWTAAFITLLSSSLLFSIPINSAKGRYSPGVFIQADGTIQGTDMIRRDGNFYTVLEDFTGPLWVEKDNIIIDGAGHTVTGGRGRGIVLAERYNVTLKNARVTLDGGYIIDVEYSRNCALVGNTLVGNPHPIPGLPPPQTPLIGPIGVTFLHSQGITVKDNVVQNFFSALSLDWSSDHTIIGNTFVDGIAGLDLTATTGCLFRNNRMVNCGFSLRLFEGYEYENDLDTSNTIDGEPIYYWLNHNDETVPYDAAYVVLVNCTNITVEKVSPRGIALISTTNSFISRVKMTGRSDGINLQDCSAIRIVDNILRDQAAVRLGNSEETLISHNEISSQTYRGVDLGSGSNNLVSGNTFFANGHAVALSPESAPEGNVIISNNFTGNDCAISVHGSCKVQDNIFEGNSYGILFSGGSGSIVTQNTLVNNNVALSFSASSGNSIYLNNFIDNDFDVSDAGLTNQTMSNQVSGVGSGSARSVSLTTAKVDEVNFFPPPPPSTNIWDNGAEGNYWSDYTGLDSNRDGIGDEAYYLYENNQDHFPLMNPVDVSEVPTALDEWSLLTPSPSFSQQPASTDSLDTELKSDPFSITVVHFSGAIVAVATMGAGLLVYFKKRRH